MLKTLKRHIALVAVSVLGASGLAVVAAPSANANLASTAAVSAVRATKLDGTNVDAVRYVPMVITHNAAYARSTSQATDEATITLTSAPSAAAKVVFSTVAADASFADAGGTALGNNRLTFTLAAATQAFLGNTTSLTAAASGKSTIYVAANVAGTYSGTIRINGSGAANATADDSLASWSFTTTGAPASVELTSSAQSVPAGGSSDWEVTVKDANGNPTTLGVFDSIGVTCSTTTCTGANLTDTETGTQVTAISDDMIADGNGVASVTHTASAGAGQVTTISFKALGLISALGTKTATLTETSQTIDQTLVIATPTVTTTPAAAAITGAYTAQDGWTRTAEIKTGTSAVTVGITAPATKFGKEFRFKISASAGTVDGIAYTTAVYKNVVTDATTGKGSFSFTLGGAALLDEAVVTVSQVTVVNALVVPANGTGGADATLGDETGKFILITQEDATFGAGTITLDPTGATVAKLGSSVSVKVSVANSYEEPLGAGYVVRALRGATLLDSKTTGADGTATVSVTNAATLTAGSAETYTFQVQPPTGAAVTATAQLQVTYTATGAISLVSLALTNTGGTPTTPITSTTLDAANLVIPVVYVPSDGFVSTQSEYAYTRATATATNATPNVSATGAGEYFTIKPTLTGGDTPVTYTGSEGVRFCSSTSGSTTATSCSWSTGVATVTAAPSRFIHVYSIKTGEQTYTATVGELKATGRFVVYNRAVDGHVIKATPATQDVTGNGYGKITVTVEDIFGNVVDTAASQIVATITGNALLDGLSSSVTTQTGAAGTATLTLIGNAVAGDASITIAGVTTGADAATAWKTGYTKPTGAGDPVKTVTVAAKSTGATASAAQTAETTAIKADVKAVSDTVATLSKAVTTIQSSVTELTSSFSAQIKSLSSAIAKISRAIAALSKRIK